MTRSKGRWLSVLFCMALTLIMCFAFSTTGAYADDGQVISSGTSVTPTSMNSIKGAESVKVYATPKTASSSSEDFTYNINAKKGTLFIYYTASPGASCFISNITGADYAGSGTSDSVDYRKYYVPSTGTVKATFTVYGAVEAQCAFSVCYVPAGKTVKSGKQVLLGSPGFGKTSTVKIKVPSNGYLKVSAGDAFNESYGVYMKTKGFKDWNYLSSSNGFTDYIGVKKGTYTIQLKNADVYNVKVNFVKVKETSCKTAKSKAASLRKGKAQKGLVFVKKTAADYKKKRVHWYKMKLTSNQKVTLNVDARKMSDAGGSGRLTVTIYASNGQKLTDYVYGETMKKLSYYTIGLSGNKLKKGTYYIKVQSDNYGNGVFTVKWK